MSTDNTSGHLIPRRLFVKHVIAASATTACATDLACPYGRAMGESVVALLHGTDLENSAASVRPMIGTGGYERTFPGAMVPFGLVQLSPDTTGHAQPQWWRQGRNVIVYSWERCSGYFYPDNVIRGFSHTHISGTGVPELGDVLLMPGTGPVRWNPGGPGWQHDAQVESIAGHCGWVSRQPGYASRFSHQHETAHPGYYRVLLEDSGVLAELTATTRCGMHRYTFPGGKQAHLILDLVHAQSQSVFEAQLNVENATTISDYRGTHGWAPNRQVYFVMEFSRPFASCQFQRNGKVQSGSIASVPGPKIKAAFGFSNSPSTPLVVKVGISGASIEGARKNLQAEMPHWNFDKVATKAADQWSKALGVLEAKLPNRELTETFYTAAYHGLIGPTTFNDVDGKYRGEDHKNHANPGFTNYTTMSIWDIYRSEMPLLTMIEPQRSQDMAQSVVEMAKQHGFIDRWPEAYRPTGVMNGLSLTNCMVEIWQAGLHHFDIHAAYQAIAKQCFPNYLKGHADLSPIHPYQGLAGEKYGSILPVKGLSRRSLKIEAARIA